MVALELCLQHLEPKPNDLKDANKRLSWCNRVQLIRPVIQVMKNLIARSSKKQNVVGDQFSRIWRECRCVVNQSCFLEANKK